MPNPFWSEEFARTCDSSLVYTEMNPGDVLTVYATDAATRLPESFRLQVIGFMWRESTRVPIYRFLKNTFAFFGADKKTPIRVKKRTRARAGTFQRHIPCTSNDPIHIGSIGLEKDYSLEYLSNGRIAVYAECVTRVTREPFQYPWVPPQRTLDTYIRKTTRLMEYRAITMSQQDRQLAAPLVIRTRNSIYRLTASDEHGFRTMKKDGEPEESGYDRTVRLLSARVGEYAILQVILPQSVQPLRTSPIVSIDPDPETN